MLYYFVKIYQRCLSLEKTILKKSSQTPLTRFFKIKIWPRPKRQYRRGSKGPSPQVNFEIRGCNYSIIPNRVGLTWLQVGLG